jgi:integrase|nr:MAG TPA: site specific tyrosine recombinase [Caudoviricetes sp.]
MNAAIAYNLTTANIIDMSGRKSRRKISQRQVVVTEVEAPTNHSADAFMCENDINAVIRQCFKERAYHKMVMFIFGINTGYRCGDILSFKVKDVTDENGNILDVKYISEQKTGKARPVYFNRAVKTALKYLIDRKELTSKNYLFRGDGNRRAYFDKFIYDECGEITDVITTGERYDENGNEREITPMTVSSVSRWLKTITQKLNIVGHYSSHAMRKTFCEFISRNWNDNRNVMVACVAVAHADVDTTMNHYMTVNPLKLRQKWLDLNLGLEEFEKLSGYKI